MAKPRASAGARKPDSDTVKKHKKSKVKGVNGRSKGKFKSTKRSKVTKKPATKDDQPTKVGGVKRAHSDKGEIPNKKQKLAPPLDRKERKELRKSHRPHSDLVSESKALWERLRRHNLEEDQRTAVMDALMELLSGHMYELSLKHDTARVVQSLLKNGTTEQRTAVFKDLQDHIVELSKLKYAKFTVKAILKYCTPSERGHVISSLHGNVRKLIRHSEAAEIVEMAYNEYANANQRGLLIQEFYGPTFSLFTDSAPTRPLTSVLDDNPDHRVAILKHLKESLLPLCEKSVIRHSIVHRALLDYFTCCDHKDRAEMIEHLREVVVHILHTREGSKVTLNCLWHGTAKDRKLIIKSLKTFVHKICLEENGHLVLLGLFDCVDDTVLIKKTVLAEMISALEDIINDQHGRHVVLYLLSPRSPRHFSPQFLDLLTPGDHNTHSKKAMDVRWHELLVGVAKPLITLATSRVVDWCRSKPHTPLLLQMVESLQGQNDLCPLFEALSEEAIKEFTEDHIVTHPCGHWAVRRLLEAPKNEESSQSVSAFAEMLFPKLTTEHVQKWASTNRGAFVVCSLLKSGVDGVKGQVTTMLGPMMSSLKQGEFKGQEALLNDLKTK